MKAITRSLAFISFAILPFELVAEQTTVAPTTISEEAQAFISMNSAPILKPETRAKWQEASNALAPVGQISEEGKELLKTYPAEIEVVSIDGAKHLMVTPKNFDSANEKRLVIYLHGGAYTLGRPEEQMPSAAVIAHKMQLRVLVVRYPLAWQAPFPAARNRVIAVYEKMLETYSPRHIAISGDSAGGGLSVSSVMAIRDKGLPMPAVMGLISPWVDVSKTGDSMLVADGHDPLLSYDKTLARSAELYAGDLPLSDPGVSPIYGDFSLGFPPSYISTGTRDLFLSHAARLQRKLTDAGVINKLFVYEGMWHVFQVAPEPAVPEVDTAWRDYVQFLDTHLAR